MQKSITSTRRMKALESMPFVFSAFENAGEDLESEDASVEKVSEEFLDVMEKFNEAQRVEEIAQEQFCNSRERHDKDFPEMQVAMLKMKDDQRFCRNCARTGL